MRRSRLAWRGCVILGLVVCGACGDAGAPPLTDPVDGIPEVRQRATTRTDLGLQWPLEQDTGTLACDSGAVIFRANGVNYAVNDAARSRGFTPIEPIVRMAPPRRPSNPVPGMLQDQRERLFRESMRCEREAAAGRTDATVCRARLRQMHQLSEADLRQIEAEGVERLWPPASPRQHSLGPLLDLGLRLCR